MFRDKKVQKIFAIFSILLLHIGTTAVPVSALPNGAAVVNGQVGFANNGNTLTVTNSPGSIINWQGFSIDRSELVNFIQQNSSSSVLNRVVGLNPSAILGALASNGRVFLINPNGVLFGQDARIDVGGLVASTLDISNADFLAGRLNFAGELEGKVENQGGITTPSGGQVYLIAPDVENSGIITAPDGSVTLAAGHQIELIDSSNPELAVVVSAPSDKALNLGQIVAQSCSIGIYGALIEQQGLVSADSAVSEGGKIVFRASNRAELTQQSSTSANGLNGGNIQIDASVAMLDSDLSANGGTGGSISVTANNLSQHGAITAEGADGDGGNVHLQAVNALIQDAGAHISVSAAEHAGQVVVEGDASLFSSATVRADAANGSGGSVQLLGEKITLLGATVSADGASGGGEVLIGGDYQGSNPAIRNAQTTGINFSTNISANATESGDGGKVVVWSDQQTDYYGDISATGGTLSGDGGLIEVSGKENLTFGGSANASASNGAAGELLLDPKNITVDDAGSGIYGRISLIDPNPGNSIHFGDSTAVLPINGNIVVTSPYDDFSATNAGSAHLYDGTSGALISSLWGNTANDHVGIGGITTLSNGNFLIRSPDWDNGAVTSAGAVTWGSGITGVTGIVGSTNSLVGSTTDDRVGSNDTDYFRIQELTNGNYVVLSHRWDNGGIADAGAVTWGNGATGTSGVISAANSLVGSTANDKLGYGDHGIGITALTNGNYVVASQQWDNGGIVDAGAVTWADGTTGITGTVDATNSLVGSSTNDQLGFSTHEKGRTVTALNNGNYVVKSPSWDNAGLADAGAVTWGDGTIGIAGEISAANSLVGSSAGDNVGQDTFFSENAVTALTNGNYVVASPKWNNGGDINAGAATWADGTTGITGAIDSSNSLIGEWYDSIGYGGVTALSNGNYVVNSWSWSNGYTEGAGAVTWGNGTGGTTGLVTSANSLVGTGYRYYVGSGGIVGLTNGNYVVISHDWGGAYTGAVTWGDGIGGTAGTVSAANSLVGSAASDHVGSGGVTALANGNYVVASPVWNNGGVTDTGAVTWCNGVSGTTGAVDTTNSLVGSTAYDKVGASEISELANGNYLVLSPRWDNGAASNAGAVTWSSGTTGITGVVSSANSLVGSTASDLVGSNPYFHNRVTVLSNGNYVVRSYEWNNGGISAAGAVTWGDGTTGITGEISAANSLVGTTSTDNVGISVTPLSSGNYVVRSYNWDNVIGDPDVGAVTWVNGTTGTFGAIDSTNSLLGGDIRDHLGSGGVIELDGGDRFVVSTPSYGVGINSNGRVEIVTPNSSNPAIGQTYAANAATDTNITPTSITNILDTGTALVLQANNDITLNQNLTSSASGSGGNLTLQAGRSVLLNADITTDNGNLTVIGNDTAANGVVDANRDAGAAEITMASGTSIDAGSGNVAIELRDGAGKSNTTSGNIALRDISGGTISVINSGPSAGSGIQLDGTLTASATAGNSIVLAGDTFTNNTGAGLFSLDGSSRWLVWSDDPSADTRGGLSYDFKQYNATYGSSAVLGSNNGFLYTLAPTITAALTGTISRTYNGTTSATLTGANYSDSGAVDGDTITLNNPASGTYDTKHVGTGKNVSVSGLSIASAINGTAPVYGYQLARTTASGDIGTITAADLTLSTNDISRAYDGSTVAAGTAVVTVGSLFGTDTLSGGTFSYDTRHVGVGKTVTVSGVSLNDGNSGSNYNVTYADNNNSSITTAALTISTSNVSKVYDQTTTAAGTAVASGGTTLFGTDSLSGGTFSFDNKNVSSGKTVTVSGVTVNDGNSGNNYTVAYADNTNSTITAKAITASGITADNKVYDATTTAVINTGSAALTNGASSDLDNRYYTSDTVALNASGASGGFTDKNVANGKAVSISGMSLSGADAGNYSITDQATTTADITAKELFLLGLSAEDKVYDGTTDATIDSYGTLNGIVPGDTVVLDGTSNAAFDNPNVGADKVVLVTALGLTGADSTNYFIDTHQTLADIVADNPPAPNPVTDDSDLQTVEAAVADTIRIVQSTLDNTLIQVASTSGSEPGSLTDGRNDNPPDGTGSDLGSEPGADTSNNDRGIAGSVDQGDDPGGGNTSGQTVATQGNEEEGDNEQPEEVDEVLSAKGGQHVKAQLKPYCY